jgi:hypothetical protein
MGGTYCCELIEASELTEASTVILSGDNYSSELTADGTMVLPGDYSDSELTEAGTLVPVLSGDYYD